MPGTRAPGLVATYRLQLHAGFTFADAADVVPYLAGLGISHLYLSPVLQAVPGSTHGYDQCDPARLSAELGGEAGFRALVTRAREHGLGTVLDIVPNHMATSATNPRWWELLRSGHEGGAGAWFDVDWDNPDPDLHGRVMVPVLGAPVDEVLADGELRVEAGAGGATLVYHDQRFPLRGAPVGQPLETVLNGQAYVLAHWREALRRLNYRRFFDINSLVGLRQEDPAVFEDSHALILDLVRRGLVQGLRIDHVDGLRDPRQYLAALRGRASDSWLLVEKILEPGERLPRGWPVAGTTGYDFIHRLGGVFIDPAAGPTLTAFYEEFTGRTASYGEVVAECKRQAAGQLFTPDLARLERLLAPLCAAAGVVATAAERTAAITAVAVAMAVYRTYIDTSGEVAAEDRERVEAAVRQAGADPAGATGDLLRVIRDALLGAHRAQTADFALRFQQLSGPLMAKGVEDTAFYRYHRLVCLNEVGADPGTFGVAPADFHAANQAAATDHPEAMLASSTHDTKRSEDVRARLALLSQVPGEWVSAVTRWSTINSRHRDAAHVDRNTEYLLYQTLVGSWPLSEDRARQYMLKAIREAKCHTNWIDPDEGYEAAVDAFVSGVLGDPDFLADLQAFVEPLVRPGFEQSLAQCLVKLTAPGVPDIYQGTEAWDLSLVDPDNRRAVDYELRRRLLQHIGDGALDTGGEHWADGGAKVHVTACALRARRAISAAFAAGSTYTPLAARGPGADRLLAFARGTADDPMMVITAVPRLVLGRALDWSSIELDLGPGLWRDLLGSGDEVESPATGARLFRRAPVALLGRT